MGGFSSIVSGLVTRGADFASQAQTHRHDAERDQAAYARQLDAERRQRAFEREQIARKQQLDLRMAREARAHETALAHANLQREQAHEAALAQAQFEHQQTLEQAAFERELALERERTQRAREIYEAETPPLEADPGLVRARLDTLNARAGARAERARELASAQAAQRASAAARGVGGGTSARAIQRNLIDASARAGAREEAGFTARLDEQDRRHARNLLDAENRRRRAILGLEAQLEPRA